MVDVAFALLMRMTQGSLRVRPGLKSRLPRAAGGSSDLPRPLALQQIAQFAQILWTHATALALKMSHSAPATWPGVIIAIARSQCLHEAREPQPFGYSSPPV